MPTAPGSVCRSDSGGRFDRISAKFTLGDGKIVTYYAAVAMIIPRFNSANATLTYSKEEDLVGTQGFTGLLGVTTVALTVGTSSSIAGELDEPIAPALTIIGSGSWVLSPSDGDDADVSKCHCLAEYRYSFCIKQ